AGQRQRAWESFRNDPEWQKVRADSAANGLIVKRVFNTLLAPTDYSPLQ
ncbi:MAG: NIPSNAP family protein, partial [Chloroflexi bacterium]|nr:NIPSNAP family protein [Chloroflexota bacterium]